MLLKQYVDNELCDYIIVLAALSRIAANEVKIGETNLTARVLRSGDWQGKVKHGDALCNAVKADNCLCKLACLLVNAAIAVSVRRGKAQGNCVKLKNLADYVVILRPRRGRMTAGF